MQTISADRKLIILHKKEEANKNIDSGAMMLGFGLVIVLNIIVALFAKPSTLPYMVPLTAAVSFGTAMAVRGIMLLCLEKKYQKAEEA